MGDAHHILLDDRAIVQAFANVVRGGADKFHAAIEGLLVGLGADEGWQEGVVDIDDALGKTSA